MPAAHSRVEARHDKEEVTTLRVKVAPALPSCTVLYSMGDSASDYLESVNHHVLPKVCTAGITSGKRGETRTGISILNRVFFFVCYYKFNNFSILS